jgi:hypothetical protein
MRSSCPVGEFGRVADSEARDSGAGLPLAPPHRLDRFAVDVYRHRAFEQADRNDHSPG